MHLLQRNSTRLGVILVIARLSRFLGQSTHIRQGIKQVSCMEHSQANKHKVVFPPNTCCSGRKKVEPQDIREVETADGYS